MLVQLLQVFHMARLLSGSTQAPTAQDTMKFKYSLRSKKNAILIQS
jgi:hypothetical protein